MTRTNTETAPAPFDWNNDNRVFEYALRTRPNGEVWNAWNRWERSPITDASAFLAPHRAALDAGDNSILICQGREYLTDAGLDTPDTSDGFILYVGDVGIAWRARSIYPGLYDNVERLRDYLRKNDATDTAAVIDALDMILCQDRGARDDAAPAGHCRHGVYVGGCGIDWMCGACEDGSE